MPVLKATSEKKSMDDQSGLSMSTVTAGRKPKKNLLLSPVKKWSEKYKIIHNCKLKLLAKQETAISEWLEIEVISSLGKSNSKYQWSTYLWWQFV